MPTVAAPPVEVYRAAIETAVRAPSLHNSQPWRWEITAEGMRLYADRSRWLPATDPDGHGLALGCGAALHLACLGMRTRGWGYAADLLPDRAEPDLLARIRPAGRREVTDEILRAGRAARRRRSERRPFDSRPVPAAAVADLVRAARGGGAYLHVVTRPDERLDLAVAVSWADRHEQDDEAVAAELRRWVRPGDGCPDGVPAGTLPHVVDGGVRYAEVPVRDFERCGVPGRQFVPGLADERPVLAVLFTTADDRAAWLRAGQALARVLLRATEWRLAGSLISQPVDLPGIRASVRALMAWPDHPRMVLRLGWPPAGPPAPLTPRRGVDEVSSVRPE